MLKTFKKSSSYKYFKFLLVLVVKFVLEVFGAGGAVWGFCEVLTLRNPETNELFRKICVVVALVFFVRYLIVMNRYRRRLFGIYGSRGSDSKSVGSVNVGAQVEWARFLNIYEFLMESPFGRPSSPCVVCRKSKLYKTHVSRSP